ncbi:hypothetical protein ALI22I_18265 [Saccharothrix sp. ALI-22-I]|uniref:hypothetical protein n=1 Tax=Saccharothrix sp. ALI-22-I TaxID=1933778 RepID=UPI0009C77948|nr:hypothetical protein [Saccharothrix sp. ALI-22-I]ONI88901.1 hypothetical protein ALI22I_18265 [Saccharothrix sp. ALI-22-I]
MSDEVRDMIRSALADEPDSGLEFERVIADGRRRRVRRRFGALTAGAAGIVAVVAVTALVAGMTGREPSPPGVLSTAPTSTATTTAPAHPGCVVPTMTGGFPDQPRGTATPDELAESGRLNDALKQFTLPLPAGVEATPLELCVVKESWGGDFTVTGDRSVSVYVRSIGGQPPGDCGQRWPDTQCSITTLPDGSTTRIKVASGTEATLVSADVWRADGTYVRVFETGRLGSTNRVLTDDQLLAIATAPQLKVQWSGQTVPADPSARRAAELGPLLATVLPAGLRPEPVPDVPADEALRFRIRQGGYRAVVNLSDAAGSGWLMVDLQPPAEGTVACNDPTCQLIDLSDGRKAATSTETESGLTRLSLNTRAADGTRITIHASNVADTGTAANTPTRPTPPLTMADLARIAELPDLHW